MELNENFVEVCLPSPHPTAIWKHFAKRCPQVWRTEKSLWKGLGGDAASGNMGGEAEQKV